MNNHLRFRHLIPPTFHEFDADISEETSPPTRLVPQIFFLRRPLCFPPFKPLLHRCFRIWEIDFTMRVGERVSKNPHGPCSHGGSASRTNAPSRVKDLLEARLCHVPHYWCNNTGPVPVRTEDAPKATVEKHIQEYSCHHKVVSSAEPVLAGRIPKNISISASLTSTHFRLACP